MPLLEIALGGILLLWCGIGVLNLWGSRGIEVLRPDQATEPLPTAPRVSIIVPARNEEETLPALLGSLLRLDYPDYDVTLVDDASTDRTGPIADEWAARRECAGRLKVIHNRELPPGWGGKVHALNLAARAAQGEWILATDADVVFHPAVLRLAMSRALQLEARLVSLVPEFVFGSVWEKAVLPAFSFLLATLFPIRLINDPKSPRALAAGAFMLMRRADLEALGGYERLQATVVEDLRLAETFKRSGRRIFVAFTRGLFRTRMYRGARELWEGLSRSAFEGSGFSVARVLTGVVLGLLLTVLPWVSVFTLPFREGHPPFPKLALHLAWAACGVSLLVYSPVLAVFRVPLSYAFTLPLATLFYAAAALNSVWKSVVGAGVTWKGRRYSRKRPVNALRNRARQE
jgi:chlorobactene glucosyltransferase